MDRAVVTPCNIYTSLPQRSASAFRNIELSGQNNQEVSNILRKEEENGFIPAKTAPDESMDSEEEKSDNGINNQEKLDQSIITEHQSEESPYKRATDRKKRSNTFCVGGRSVSNCRSGAMKKTQAVPLVNTSTVGQRKNSA